MGGLRRECGWEVLEAELRFSMVTLRYSGEIRRMLSEVDPVLRPGLREVKLWDHGVGR